jgi:hypothetical protein
VRSASRAFSKICQVSRRDAREAREGRADGIAGPRREPRTLRLGSAKAFEATVADQSVPQLLGCEVLLGDRRHARPSQRIGDGLADALVDGERKSLPVLNTRGVTVIQRFGFAQNLNVSFTP